MTRARAMRTYSCAHCGNSFDAQYRGRTRVPQYCSIACSAARRAVWVTCEQCGDNFHPAPGGVRSKRRFCGRSCAQRHRALHNPGIPARATAASAAANRGRIRCGHGLTMYRKHGCRCDTCLAAHNAEVKRWQVVRYRESLPSASRRGYVWTGPEFELLGRDDLSNTQLAAMLNRTTYAVQTQRARLRRGEPRAVGLAGARR